MDKAGRKIEKQFFAFICSSFSPDLLLIVDIEKKYLFKWRAKKTQTWTVFFLKIKFSKKRKKDERKMVINL